MCAPTGMPMPLAPRSPAMVKQCLYVYVCKHILLCVGKWTKDLDEENKGNIGISLEADARQR